MQIWCFNGENLLLEKVLKKGADVTEAILPLSAEYPKIRIQVAARAGSVVGVPSVPVLIQLTTPPPTEDSFVVTMFRKPWLLVVTGAIVWLLLLLICIIVVRKYVSEKFANSSKFFIHSF